MEHGLVSVRRSMVLDSLGPTTTRPSVCCFHVRALREKKEEEERNCWMAQPPRGSPNLPSYHSPAFPYHLHPSVQHLYKFFSFHLSIHILRIIKIYLKTKTKKPSPKTTHPMYALTKTPGHPQIWLILSSTKRTASLHSTDCQCAQIHIFCFTFVGRFLLWRRLIFFHLPRSSAVHENIIFLSLISYYVYIMTSFPHSCYPDEKMCTISQRHTYIFLT